MPSTSYFSSAFRPSSHSDNVYPILRHTSRKRKRDSNSFEDVSAGDVFSADPNTRSQDSSSYGDAATGVPLNTSPAAISREMIGQYRIAGQRLDEDLPGLNFPHASPQLATKKPNAQANVGTHEALATLKPALPLQTEGSALRDTDALEGVNKFSLRQKHIKDMIAILHRCILEGEIRRAGRAWGMLLRSELHGRTMDLRSYDRWGLGAEILLKRNEGLMERSPERNDNFHSIQEGTLSPPSNKPRRRFSKEEIDDAKDYYERLILQFPYRKVLPSATSASDFYPAMFGLWLKSVNDQHTIAMDSIGQIDADVENKKAPSQDFDPWEQQQRVDILNSTLQQGEEIASSLNELLASPPYSDDARLWRLRGMIALWIGNLWVAALPREAGSESRGEDTSSTGDSDSQKITRGVDVDGRQHGRRLAKRQAAILKAKETYSFAMKKSGDMDHMAPHLASLQA